QLGYFVDGGAGEPERQRVVVDGLFVPALEPMDVAEADQRVQFGGAVVHRAGGGQGVPVQDLSVLVRATSAEVAVKKARQVQQLCRPVVFAGVPRGGE